MVPTIADKNTNAPTPKKALLTACLLLFNSSQLPFGCGSKSKVFLLAISTSNLDK